MRGGRGEGGGRGRGRRSRGRGRLISGIFRTIGRAFAACGKPSGRRHRSLIDVASTILSAPSILLTRSSFSSFSSFLSLSLSLSLAGGDG